MGDEPLARRAEGTDEPLARRAEGTDEPLARRAEGTDETPESGSGPSMLRDVGLYAVARLLLVAALAALIYGVARAAGVHDFPLYVALAFAIVIALPLGIWAFTPLRRRATASVAAFDERRRRDRERLQARLRGETPPN